MKAALRAIQAQSFLITDEDVGVLEFWSNAKL